MVVVYAYPTLLLDSLLAQFCYLLLDKRTFFVLKRCTATVPKFYPNFSCGSLVGKFSFLHFFGLMGLNMLELGELLLQWLRWLLPELFLFRTISWCLDDAMLYRSILEASFLILSTCTILDLHGHWSFLLVPILIVYLFGIELNLIPRLVYWWEMLIFGLMMSNVSKWVVL